MSQEINQRNIRGQKHAAEQWVNEKIRVVQLLL